MQDPDLIASVFPITENGDYALNAIAATSRYLPRLQLPKPQPSRRDRESTQPPEEPDAPAHCYKDRLELRFGDIPRTSRGLVFGCGPNSDVVLPNIQGVSYCHFSLTFDDAKRLIVRDWDSLLGTEVTYNGEGSGRRSHFRWIVGGHPVPKEKASIKIKVCRSISFQIMVAQHDIESQDYIDQVDRFSRGTAAAEDLLGRLDFPDRGTERPSGDHTPATGAIHLREKLGEGGFGVVTRCWNVSDGSEYALKEPNAKAIRKQRVNAAAWAKEAGIMEQLSHSHIVKLHDHFLTPHPQLHLEFVPGGSLDDHDDISTDEALSILNQCLSAVTYLHGQKPPVVHRDIKPGNILVQHRFPGNIYVKFGDFGLSRHGYDLSTICGSRRYLAPEIYSSLQYVNFGGKERISYTPSVDIWSLGVVVYELMFRLPRYLDEYTDGGTAWCEKVLDTFEKDEEQRPSELRRFLLRAMVVMSPDSRCSAQDCHDQAMLLSGSGATEEGCQTPTPASYNEDEQATLRLSAQNHVRDDRKTDDLSDVTIDTGRYIRSFAPAPASQSPPSASRAANKTLRSSTPPSTGRGSKRRDSRNSPIASSQQPPESACFLVDYSQNPLDPLYVGSSLGQQELPSGWATTQSTQKPTPRNSTAARKSTPKTQSRVHVETDWAPSTPGGDSVSTQELYANGNEKALEAALLQAMR